MEVAVEQVTVDRPRRMPGKAANDHPDLRPSLHAPDAGRRPGEHVRKLLALDCGRLLNGQLGHKLAPGWKLDELHSAVVSSGSATSATGATSAGAAKLLRRPSS